MKDFDAYQESKFDEFYEDLKLEQILNKKEKEKENVSIKETTVSDIKDFLKGYKNLEREKVLMMSFPVKFTLNAYSPTGQIFLPELINFVEKNSAEVDLKVTEKSKIEQTKKEIKILAYFIQDKLLKEKMYDEDFIKFLRWYIKKGIFVAPKSAPPTSQFKGQLAQHYIIKYFKKYLGEKEVKEHEHDVAASEIYASDGGVDVWIHGVRIDVKSGEYYKGKKGSIEEDRDFYLTYAEAQLLLSQRQISSGKTQCLMLAKYNFTAGYCYLLNIFHTDFYKNPVLRATNFERIEGYKRYDGSSVNLLTLKEKINSMSPKHLCIDKELINNKKFNAEKARLYMDQKTQVLRSRFYE